MNTRKIFGSLLLIALFTIIGVLLSCRSARVISNISESDTLTTNMNEKGPVIIVDFTRGKNFNHPLMAVWIEDTNGHYLQTIYVAESIAKGIFGHADASAGKWMPGPLRRPAALPVWSHSRNIKEEDDLYIPTTKTPLPDAVTGPTPQGNFTLISKLAENIPSIFNVYFEINQSWDWNEYWTNNKFPEDNDYKTSSQPSLIYMARMDTISGMKHFEFNLIGHGHYSGKDGEIYRDLSTITTAKNITDKIHIYLR
jgi:hypothetical protein